MDGRLLLQKHRNMHMYQDLVLVLGGLSGFWSRKLAADDTGDTATI